MFYRVIDVSKVKTVTDIRVQLKQDKKIQMMRNNELFIQRMVETDSAREIVVGELRQGDIKQAFIKALESIRRSKKQAKR
jgi:hypothetical protein